MRRKKERKTPPPSLPPSRVTPAGYRLQVRGRPPPCQRPASRGGSGGCFLCRRTPARLGGDAALGHGLAVRACGASSPSSCCAWPAWRSWIREGGRFGSARARGGKPHSGILVTSERTNLPAGLGSALNLAGVTKVDYSALEGGKRGTERRHRWPATTPPTLRKPGNWWNSSKWKQILTE